MESCIRVLAESNLKVGKEIKVILEKLILEGRKYQLLDESSCFGNGQIANFLLNEAELHWFMEEKLWKIELEKALSTSILSDNIYCCKIVKEYCETIGVETKTMELKKLAAERGRTEMVELFNLQNVEVISPKYEDVLDKFPKAQEFQYFNIMDKIVPMVLEADSRNRRLITFEDLLSKLHTPPIHPKELNCPDDCQDKQICRRVKDIVQVLRQVLEKISVKYTIFKDAQPIIVGSLKEGANIGDVDETDIVLVLNTNKSKDIEKCLIFDKNDQQLKVRKYYWENKENGWTKRKLELPEKLKPFVTKKEMKESDLKHYYGCLDEDQYFFIFLQEFHQTLSSSQLKLPEGMKLSTTFTPCEVCKDTTFTRHQYVRCRHDPMCQNHQEKCKCQNYHEKCKCKRYNSPALTISKIGLVMHPQFEENGQLYHLDVDINPPTLPVGKIQMVRTSKRTNDYVRADQWKYDFVIDVRDEPDFDGNNTDKRNWLLAERKKLTGWKTEYDKTLDNSEAAGVNDGLPRPIRLRCYNLKDVIVEQVKNLHSITVIRKYSFSVCYSTERTKLWLEIN